MRIIFFLVALALAGPCVGQSLKVKIERELSRMEANPQFRHAAVGLYVVRSETGEEIFQKNAEIGLAPASCQKVITSVSAFELLGADFRYKTTVAFKKERDSTATISVKGSGDPTLGSYRFPTSTPEIIFQQLSSALDRAGIYIDQTVHISLDSSFPSQHIPDGWVWEDIGNYYGAGCADLNWRENQFEIVLTSGERVGEAVSVKHIIPKYLDLSFINECVSGRKGSGDNAYIYSGLGTYTGYIRGTMPAGEKAFPILGAVPDPRGYFMAALKDFFLSRKNNISIEPGNLIQGPIMTPLLEYRSPSLDSMNYWFLKKSINLYGEAFVKAIAMQKNSIANTDSGLAIIRKYWSANNISTGAFNIIDGSGLSPANRVTSKGLVQLLQFARRQPWFSSFYNALPEMNGIKMKDGYIGGVRSYTGYVKSPRGNFTFAFIVNNFQGSAATVREQMWKVLDVLK